MVFLLASAPPVEPVLLGRIVPTTAWRRAAAFFMVLAVSVLLPAATAEAAAEDPWITPKYHVQSVVGYPVSEQFEVTGGTAPFTFSAYPGLPLPPGLSIDAAGLVTGTPARTGAWQSMVQVADAEGRTTTSGLVWEVGAPLTFVGLRSVTSFEGQETARQLEILNPENVPVRFTAIGLPAGLKLDENTGRITGRATVVGAGEVFVTLYGPDGHTATRTLTWTVHATPRLKNPGDQVSVVDRPVRLALEVEHNGNPLSFSSWTLPYGLDIDEATGVITGTPAWSQEAETVTISVYDTQTGARTEVSFSWRVDAA